MNLTSDKVGKSIFLTLCVMGGFAILSSTLSKTMLNPFATTLHTPTGWWVGVVGAASTIPGILVSLPASSLSDIYGRRKFLLLSGFLFATAPFLYLFISVWWQLILVRFYHGFATAIFVPVAEASMAEAYPAQRGERISLFTSATYVGRSIAPFMGGYILFTTASGSDPLFNFHIMYIVAAATGLVAFIMALLFLAERKPSPVMVKKTQKSQSLYRGWATLVTDHAVLVVSFVQASLYFSYGIVDYFLSGYLKNSLNFDYFSTAAVSGSIIVLAIFVRAYMGRVSDRTGRRGPILIGLIVCSVPLILLPYSSNLGIILLLSLIYGFGFATASASTCPLITELVPSRLVGASTGFLDTMMDVGQTLGPLIGGFVLGASLGYVGLFLSATAVLLFACLVFVLSKVARRNIEGTVSEDSCDSPGQL